VAVSRPLPIQILKKMFLKVLHEHKRPGGFYNGHGWGYEGIVRNKITEFFKIERLSDQEYADGLRGVYELERDGFIMRDPSQSEAFKILTQRGAQVVDQSLDEMRLPSIDIDQLLKLPTLRDKVHDDYVSGDYESAIFKAFKMLEETVRAKTKQPPNMIGADLMSKAFRPGGGILKHPNAKTPAEEEAFHLIMRGSIMWFKNPSSHRTVGFSDPEQAAHVLCFANLLMDLVDEC